jgi:ABC-type glycerol-3-phosphate transport system permease component
MATESVRGRRPRGFLRKGRRRTLSRVFLYVLVILIAIWSLFPIWYMVNISLMDTADVVGRPPKWIPWPPKFKEWRMVAFVWEDTAKLHYEEGAAITAPRRIPGAVGRSFVVALGATILNLIIGSFAGYAMARYPDFWFTNSTLNLLMITRMLPGLALAIPFFILYRTIGLINTLHGLIIAYTSFVLPLTVWVMRGYFSSVPRSLEWSAQVDGCNWFQAFRRVFLPVSAPGLVAAGIFTFLVAWNEFLFALILVQKADVQTVTLAITALTFPDSGRTRDFTAMFVAGSMAIIPPVLIAFVFQRYLVQGLLSGATKG